MNEKQIRNLIRLVEESEIDSLEISGWGPFQKVRIVGKGATHQNGHAGQPMQAGMQPGMQPVFTAQHHQHHAPAPVATPPPQVIHAAPPVHAPAPEASAPTASTVEIKSPMVGTFYASSSPDNPPYVSVGDKVTSGQVICIVEAMKLMNEIEAEVSGRVIKVLGQNGKPVEFGQVLFLIEPD